MREPLVPRAVTPVIEKKKPLSALLNSASAPQLINPATNVPSKNGRNQTTNTSNVSQPTNSLPHPPTQLTNNPPNSPSTSHAKMPTHHKAGAGTMVEAGVGMDGFIEGQSSDWMIQRLQKEQIDNTVNIHTTQMSTPLPVRTEGTAIWRSIPEITVLAIS